MGLVVSGGGACYASSYTECIHDDCHPMNGVNKSLERFMKMEEEFVSSVKCLGNHLNDLEKLDMRLSAQENYIRSIRLKLQGLIHGSAGISDGYAGMPNVQNNLNSQTVINNQTTMNTNNTCINSNFMQNVQNNSGQASTYDVCTSDNVRLQQHGIAQVDAKDAEINDLKKNKPSGLSAEDKGYIKLMYENLKNGEMKGAIRVKYTFVTDPTQITPPFKNK
ncbi:MAG: hypothetical protein IJS10_03895 [Alphaproteobacteria bacterium]|nr:hypothetical protein [Alphaproteobacteria bacterium]